MVQGSVSRRYNGYGAGADLGADPGISQQRQVSRQGVRTKREAESALDQLLSSVRTGSTVSRSATDVAGFLDDGPDGQRRRLKGTTLSSYGISIERVKRRIGKLKLRALTPRDIERLCGDLLESGSGNGRAAVGQDGSQHPCGLAQGIVRC